MFRILTIYLMFLSQNLLSLPAYSANLGSFSAATSTYHVGVINLTWHSLEEVTRYTLQESKNSASWITVSSSLTHASQYTSQKPTEYFGRYTRSGLTAGIYQYRLQVCINSMCSAWRTSNTIAIVFPPTKPNAIVLPLLTVINGTVEISWPASSNTSHYKLQEKKNNGRWVTLTQSTTSLNYSRIVPTDAYYTYRVTACNTAGCDASWRTSTIVNVILPPVLPSLSAAALIKSPGNVSLSWGTFSAILDADTYTLQQAKDNGAWTTISSTLKHSVSGGNNGKPITYHSHYTATGLTHGSYQYRLKACKSTSVCTGWRNSNTVKVL